MSLTQPDPLSGSPSSSPSGSPPLSADFWEGRYQAGTARWDLGEPAPPFVSLLNSEQAPAPGRMAVLGSGCGHDALLFAAHGFEVTGFDFAPSAIADAQAAARRLGLDSAQFLQRDIFELNPEFAASFDYLLEHTCFCAISPDQRGDYLRLVQQILRPGGELIALFWTHERPGGPPFGVAPADLQRLLKPSFEIQSWQLAKDSVESRRSEEYLARLRVRLWPS